jgi:hypothetical protein
MYSGQFVENLPNLEMHFGESGIKAVKPDCHRLGQRSRPVPNDVLPT